MKTSDLTGVALDWAVADCEGHDFPSADAVCGIFNPSTYWAHGGPIIEREWLDITPWPNESDEELHWQCKQHDSIDCIAFGPTPLIAAMRCYVASKMGDNIDIPKELIE